MNKASVRKIMLQHERTFKEQVQDLHELYGKQKRLMAETSQSRGRDAYFVMPPPLPSSSNAAAEEIKPGHGIDFLEQAMNGGKVSLKGAASTQTPCSLSNAISDWTVKVEENPRSIVGPARKRKIDLEQPPEDESDGEVENSSISLNATTSCWAADSGELQTAYSGFGALSQQVPIPSLHASQLLLTTATHSDCGALGESEMVNESQGDSCIRSLPCIPPSLMNTEQTFAGLGERNLSFHDSGTSKTGSGPGNNYTMFSPHADLVDMASQETERRAHWIFQSPESNIVDTSVKFTAQKQQSPSLQFAPPELSSTVNRPLLLHRSQRHPISKSLWAEPVSSANGNVSLERHSLGASCGAQNGTMFASAQRSGDASNWFLTNSFLQGASISSVPMDHCESGIAAGGGHSMAGGVLVPTINKGLGQGHDASIWSSKSPIVQLPRYQQQPFPQQQTDQIGSQSLWVQSFPTAQNSPYHQQQILYGLGTPSPVQMGYQSELLQRGQGDISGLCNMVGIGHYHSSVHLPPNSPPFKTPPKLVLKNDVIGMELKSVLPEKEVSEKEKFVPKVPSTSVKIDAGEVFSKSCEIESSAPKDHGQDDRAKEKVTVEKEVAPEEQRLGSSRFVKDSLTMNGLPTEAAPLAVAPLSSAQAFSQACSASVAPPFLVAQVNQGDRGCTSGSEIGSAPNVIPSHNGSVAQEYGPQSEVIHRNSESEKLVKHRVMNLETFGVISEKEEALGLGQINSGTKDMWGQPEGAGFSEAGIDRNVGLNTKEERNDSLNKLLSTVATVIEGSHKYESGSFDATQQNAQSRSEKEDASNEQLQHRATKEDEGSVPEQFENAVLGHVYSCESKGSLNADSSHSTDVQVTQEVSVQSASTGKPSISRLPRWSPLKDSNAGQKVTGRLSCICNNKSGSPLSDKDGACASSPLTCMSDRRSEAVASAVNEDLQHDDSDNLAASILLSFAPKLDQPNMDKQQKDSVSEISNIIGKIKPADQGRKLSQLSEDQICLHLDHWNSASSRGRRRQNSGSLQGVDWTEDCDHSKVTMKDRRKGDVTKSTKPKTGEGDASTERFTSKLPRVTGSTINDNNIPISRSKQHRKLSGVSIFHNPVESMNNFPKNIEAVHTPTGRRSSRGPLLRARGLLEGRSQPHRLTQHCVESSPPPLDKDLATKGGVCSLSRLEENMKSKSWGELNRTWSHPHKQFLKTAHRKSQN